MLWIHRNNYTVLQFADNDLIKYPTTEAQPQDGAVEYDDDQQEDDEEYDDQHRENSEANDVINENEDYDGDDDVVTEPMESPKYNGSNDNAAPKPGAHRFQDSSRNNFLYQMSMDNEEKKKYFLNNFPKTKLLPHLTPTRKCKHCSYIISVWCFHEHFS